MDQCKIHELFFRITAGNDQEAFREFYNHFFLILLRFTFSLTRSKEVAEEITNDVFLHCWQKRHALRDLKNPQVYLFVMAKNRVIDHRRRHALSRHLTIPAEDALQVSFTSDPEQLLITAEMMLRMEAEIMQLPPKCRMVYIMVKQYGLKYKEVAVLMHLSVKTVENQLAIAVKRLTQALSFTLNEEVPRKV